MDKKRVKFLNSNLNPARVKKPVDLSQCLPSDLHDRVSKIINIPCGKEDPFEERKKLTFKDLLSELDPNLVKKMDAGVTEDNFADIVEKYQQMKTVNVTIEPRMPERKMEQLDINWIADYIKKMKKERIVWQTKLFKDNKEIYEKPLFEMTEELIDIAAEHFAIWLKQMVRCFQDFYLRQSVVTSYRTTSRTSTRSLSSNCFQSRLKAMHPKLCTWSQNRFPLFRMTPPKS